MRWFWRRSARIDDEELRCIRIDAAMQSISQIMSVARELPALTPDSVRPEMTVHRRAYGAPQLIWRISVPESEPVYMTAHPAPAGAKYDVDRWVVHVQMREFYGAWLAADTAVFGEDARARNPREIVLDRKWGHQGPNWKGGIERPVPLSEVGYHPSTGVQFIDGTTRMLWLAHHRVSSFPVMIRGIEGAIGLHDLVGDPSLSPNSIAELLKV